MWSKFHLVMGAYESGYALAVVVIGISTLLNIAYLLPPVVRAFLNPLPEGERDGGVREAPMFCVVPLCFTALACLAIFFMGEPLRERLFAMFAG
jgi:multicomponent Na+:H+ antiporter subunit D